MFSGAVLVIDPFGYWRCADDAESAFSVLCLFCRYPLRFPGSG